MKKYFLIIILFFLFYGTCFAVSLTEDHHKFYFDNGGPNNPNNALDRATEDSSCTWENSVNLRLRVKFHTTGTTPNMPFKLKYSVDGGAYADISGAIPVPPTVWYVSISASPNFADRSSTTERLTNSGGSIFQPGNAMDTNVNSNSLSLSGGRRTECEWSIIFSTYAVGHTITFQPHSVTPPDDWSYSTTPTVSIVNPSSTRISGNTLRITGNSLRIR